MENAAQALRIAAGILISIMILGIVVYQYSNMSELKRVQMSAEQEEQAVDFNKGFEAFNRELYGTELIALANKVKHFNKTYVEDGYEEITLKVDNIDSYPHYNKVNGGPHADDLATLHQKLEEEVKTHGEKKFNTDNADSDNIYTNEDNSYPKTEIEIDGKKYSYAQLYKTNDKTLKSMGFTITSGTKTLWTYTKLLKEMQDFSREKFESVNWEYSNITGRVIRIEFRKK